MGGRSASPRLKRLDPAWLLALAYLGGATAMWGVYFDTAWHRTLSRDSFFSLPHAVILGGGALVWLSAVVAIALASRDRLADLGGPRARTGPIVWPFGFTLAGAGVFIVVGVAAPMDAWWHGVFGKDVLIWSPPHLVAVLGGATAATGLLFAAAAQRGRGALADARWWKLAMLPPAVDLIFRVHWTLAHYTMTPATRTPDYYPFLVALGLPMVLVAIARAVGPWAAPASAALFCAATILIDAALRAIGFERYTITPVVAIPALALAWVLARARCGSPAVGDDAGKRDVARVAVGAFAGVAFALVFVAMEAAWMAAGVRRPWPFSAVLAALPRTLAAGALSGAMGWIAGGFLLAQSYGADEIFGSRVRARRFAIAAALALLLAAAWTYRPFDTGAPMRVADMALVPLARFPVQEAVFWEAVLDDDWARAPRLELYSEGIIDQIPLPIGPAWCAADAAALARDLPRLRFAMRVNDEDVDLAPYPRVRQRLRDGRECAWVGVVSRAQQPGRNRFVYTITPLDASTPPLPAMTVDATVVFKNP